VRGGRLFDDAPEVHIIFAMSGDEWIDLGRSGEVNPRVEALRRGVR
jgi:hypothetical protein